MWNAIGYVVAAIIGFVAAILTVRVKFDLNQYLRERRTVKAQRQCQHYDVSIASENGFVFELWLERPPGSLAYVCSGCGIRTTRGGAEGVKRHMREVALKALKDAGIDPSVVEIEEKSRFLL